MYTLYLCNMIIWSLDDPALRDRIELSHKYNSTDIPFPTFAQQTPLYTTADQLHGMQYIDCVLWYGDCILSGCTEHGYNQVLLWTPDGMRYPVSTCIS